HQLSADDRRELFAVSITARALQPAVLPPNGFGSAAAFLFIDLGGAVLWFGGLVSRREAHAATVAPPARDGTWYRSRVFECARGAGSVAGCEVGVCANAEVSRRGHDRRHVET